MTRRPPYIIFIMLAVAGFSCGVNRYLPKDENLYYGASIKVEKEPGVKASNAALGKKLSGLATPKRNKMFLGKPYKVWWWYVIGPSKKDKGFKHWLRNTLGEAPVLSADL